MSQDILWNVPTNLNSNVTYTVQIFQSQSGENGQYSLIDSISANTNQYTDQNGNSAFFYYVFYNGSDSSRIGPVLAVLAPFITERRIALQIQGKLPNIISARIDSNLIDIRKAMQNALDAINAYSPSTGFTYTNLPGRFETAIVILAMAFLYLEHQLQVGIRDYTYGGTGISLQVDRNSRFASTISALQTQINSLLQFIKMPDWPTAPDGLGSIEFATPQQRILGILFNRPG